MNKAGGSSVALPLSGPEGHRDPFDRLLVAEAGVDAIELAPGRLPRGTIRKDILALPLLRLRHAPKPKHREEGVRGDERPRRAGGPGRGVRWR